MSLNGKSALITGATGAIGESICVELLKNGVTHLAAIDISSVEPVVVAKWRKNYPEASIRYFQVDVSSQEELEKCFKDFTKNLRSLDIVVNCAGIFNENIPKTVIDVNLTGVILSSIIAIEYMRKDTGRGMGGVVLNIASIAGLNACSTAPTYSATKHAVVAYTRALAHERDYLGIKFLTLCPGCTDTKLFANVFEFGFLTSKEKDSSLLNSYGVQSPEAVGKASVKYILEGKTGSVWIIEDNEIQEAPVPEIKF
ncbi:alcohol dehydrogenase 1-like [Lutzomyia longipalpis]|uniref:alcohol dehydrogenase 1-like n=1 Tax=Lutzomyia longipalpis TaxID=7200 RepID=UPI002483B7AC|nr:alcohol dehydrogenase 1-like [Lutzomyia longipalpis]